uniref:Glycerate kinase n=1 Tax=uncultured Muribaculaceae bacterium TaxID=2301481 RepID=A0A6G8F493_9BACT|nr:glycerate kinase [uncultured Muribaculaceae bacterium]
MQVEVVSVSDGGEGTSDALREALGGRERRCMVSGPLGDPTEAGYVISGDGSTAVMEMAKASGLTLLEKERRNPLKTSSYGTGQMILDAVRNGCRHIIIGIGGSATVDGGTGMLAALGVKFIDGKGKELKPSGGMLESIAGIDLSGLSPELKGVDIRVICDVDNPLCGERGSARVFGPQKGADREMVERLESGMTNYAAVLCNTLGRDVSTDPGSGAAGGLGAALKGVLGASLEKGIDVVLSLIDFDRKIKDASLIITGEGSMDSQTLHGKTPWGIMKRGEAEGIPVVAVAGVVRDSELLESAGFSAIFPIVPGPCLLSDAMDKDTARHNLIRTSRQIARLFMINTNLFRKED